MRRIASLLALITLVIPSQRTLQAQESDFSQHFKVFTGGGEPASLEDIVSAMADADAVLIGEIHTDPVGHWVETELFRMAVEHFRAGDETGALRPVGLSVEMFERDVQYIVDEYLQGLITEKQFMASARPWEYYEDDYKAMVELAKEKGLPVIAANAPRRYVNRVSRGGREALMELSLRARGYLPPLPYPQPTEAYRAEWTALMSNMSMEDQCPAPEPEDAPMIHPAREDSAAAGEAMEMPSEDEKPAMGGMPSHAMGAFIENGLQAQTLWDSSMGYAMATFLEMNPGALVLHMVGGFHVENHTGTPEKVEFYRPGTRSIVVSMQLAEDFNTFDPEEHTGLGDFVVLTDESLDLNIPRNCSDVGGEG